MILYRYINILILKNMATSTKKDEQDDLIILDDTDNFMLESDLSDTPLNNDSEIVNLDNDDSLEIIDFDEKKEVIQDESTNIDETSVEPTNDNILSFWEEKISKSSQDNSTKIEQKETNNDFSFDLTNDNTQTWSKQSNSEVFDLDSATEQFITQLNKRKEQISSFIKKDESSIADLEEQIKQLKQQVTDFNANIKTLKDEDTKIDDRISVLTSTQTKTTKKRA